MNLVTHQPNPSLHFTSLHFTSLHFTSLHFTSLHSAGRYSPGVRFSLYNIGADPTESIVHLSLRTCSFRRNVFTESLLRNGLHNPYCWVRVYFGRYLVTTAGALQCWNINTLKSTAFWGRISVLSDSSFLLTWFFPYFLFGPIDGSSALLCDVLWNVAGFLLGY
jgi:hypothetical protein